MSFVAVAIGGAGLIGSIGGGLIAAHGANQAANTQAGSADYAANLQSQYGNRALDINQQQFATGQQELAPYLQSGYGALANLNYLMGIPNSNDPLYSPYSQQGQSSTPQTATYQGSPNVPQYIPGPHGSDMLNPAYGAQQRSNISANLPQTQTQTLGSLVNPNIGAAGSLSQGWNQTFQAPTGATEQNDPGYQFRLQQGQKALENSAAARGDVLSGNAAQAEQQYGQNYASNEYGNVYNRALGEYQQNYNQFQQNQANQYNRLASMAGLGQITAGQLNSSGQANANNAGNILLTSGQQIGNNINNAGAARASGYVGSANALAGGFSGGLSNLAQGYTLANMLGGGGGGNLGTQGAQAIGNQDFGVV